MSDDTDYRYTTADGNEPTDQNKKSQATRLIELAETVELFHDADGKGYVTLKINGHKETWPIYSQGFRDWLCHQFYLAEKRAPSSSSLQDAVKTIHGRARYDGAERCVYLRVAEYECRIYIDLCDTQWRTIEVTADRWRVIDAPVRFIRARSMNALPEPVSGDINVIFDYLNVAEQDQCLVLAWLIAAMRPTGPYPVLILQGEQGTAKSTAAKVLRSLVDPSAALLRTISRDERDLMIAARNGWIIALDNLSGLSPWLSDALCRIATGGGFATRELYSDTDEILIDVQRPIVLNGIDDIATRQDLIDRAIVINLEPIPEGKRKPEAEFWCEFNAVRPSILGALLDRVSSALRELPNTHLDTLPRMADFAKWVTAAEPIDEKGTFMRAYQGNRQSAIESGLEGSPVATVLREVLDKTQPLEGTATELLNELSRCADERTKMQRSWPKSAKGLSGQLRRLATALRTIGIEIEYSRDGKDGTRNIHIQKVCKDSSEPSAASANKEDQALTADQRLTQVDMADASLTDADAPENELSHCSTIIADATDASDANLPPYSETHCLKRSNPTFEIIPNSDAKAWSIRI